MPASRYKRDSAMVGQGRRESGRWVKVEARIGARGSQVAKGSILRSEVELNCTKMPVLVGSNSGNSA